MTFRRVVTRQATRRAASSMTAVQQSSAASRGLVAAGSVAAAAGFTLLPRQEEVRMNECIMEIIREVVDSVFY